MSSYSKLLTAAVLLAIAGTANAGVREDAQTRAFSNIYANPSAVRAHSGDRFAVKDTIIDANGDEHVRFTRTWAGMDVIGGDFVTHSRGGALRGVSQTLSSSERPGLRASVRTDDAIAIAGAEFGTGFQGVPSARLVVFALNTRPQLAYEVVFNGEKANGDPTEMHFFVNASNGRILDRWDMVHTAKPGGGGTGGGTAAVGIGNTLMYGDVSINTALSGSTYNMTDTTRGNGATYDGNNASYSTAARGATLFTDADNNWGNNATSDRATVAADAHFGVATTFDYYKLVHGRNGIFGDGKGVKSYVHVGRSWVNAAWYANAMYYGDGGGSYLPLVSLDIAGHEMSHGVNQATANLAYSNDSGGLNEANSDIMGTMVEFYAANVNDPADYRIGEEIYTNGTSALRYMYDPNLDGGASYDCYPAGGLGGVDPHYSSGPANHFFYLLAVGTNAQGMPASATCVTGNTKNATGSGTLAGIGNTKAAAIWFRAVTTKMTSGTTYPGARTATLAAAAELYGAGSPEQNAVAAAWSAILVN
jgi:Zn-dependent metalloprotease